MTIDSFLKWGRSGATIEPGAAGADGGVMGKRNPSFPSRGHRSRAPRRLLSVRRGGPGTVASLTARGKVRTSMRTSLLAISLILTLLPGLFAPPALAQQEQAEDNAGPPLRGSPRDVDAGKRALSEWW